MPNCVSSDCLTDYFRCPDKFIRFALRDDRPGKSGYFRFGDEIVCYGKYYERAPGRSAAEPLPDPSSEVQAQARDLIYLPFDPNEIVDNLRREVYAEDWRKSSHPLVAKLYYFLRPFFSVGIRKHLQRLHLRGWEKIAFPRWPVDCSVDSLLEQMLLLSLRASGEQRIPFIWFWPDGYSSCAIMTHDIETAVGRDFCRTLMDIDDSFGIKASFQVVPEERYDVDALFLKEILDRGFEVVVHDLNHDGHLYKDREQFLRRAKKINEYREVFRANGFRAGVLYRRQLWYDALEFAYDMSVPNVAHLDPQRGGCCTVMPYFVGNVLEIPVTTIQDYSLFNILGDFTIDIWRGQIQMIASRYGLMSFIVHPDYIQSQKELKVYKSLLGHLSAQREERSIWITLPGELNKWWRQRAEMKLVDGPDGWEIEGAGKERACIAYASEADGKLTYALDESSKYKSPPSPRIKAGIEVV